MSTFRNISQGTLYIQGYLRSGDGAMGVGATSYLDPAATFTGSNYYDRFTYLGMIADGVTATDAALNAILLKTIDDGNPFTDTAIDVPNNPLVYNETILASAHTTLDFNADLGGPAMFMSLETDAALSVELNGKTDAIVAVETDSTLNFAVGELLLNQVKITNNNSGASASIQVIVANIV